MSVLGSCGVTRIAPGTLCLSRFLFAIFLLSLLALLYAAGLASLIAHIVRALILCALILCSLGRLLVRFLIDWLDSFVSLLLLLVGFVVDLVLVRHIVSPWYLNDFY
jgi:hypothetical protein